ncbi:MAG: 2,3-bisphosphoglycerate-independent phosphoglycerate mutase [Abditibacteriales bacterium]|nr:2,3-bisphosphoglycerate-independent phosphoglycerate mutase [Abditibacteriales bacterium]
MLTPQQVIQSVAKKTESKIVLLVLDGLGGLPMNGKPTELEAARTPHLDALAQQGVLGLTDPIFPGITPGSGPGHLGLFGYDPLRYEIGRGIMEALGVGMEVTPRDVCCRANFATLEDGKITDRRAGRPPTSRNRELIAKLSQHIQRIDDVDVLLQSGEEHRFVLVLRGDGLSAKVEDADVSDVGEPPRPAVALAPEAETTARVVTALIAQATEVLKDDFPANTCLVRGFAQDPRLPSMTELFQLTPACIAVYPMYKGIAKLVGMTVLPTTMEFHFADQVRVLQQHWDDFDFFYVHVKKTDSYGEDGNFDAKVRVIEEVDESIPPLMSLKPDVLAVTGDHSTPARLKYHSWHPVPFLLWGAHVRPDEAQAFNERECLKGGLGRFAAQYDGVEVGEVWSVR